MKSIINLCNIFYKKAQDPTNYKGLAYSHNTPKRKDVNPELLKKIKLKYLGKIYGFDVYLVNGEIIRDKIFEDFVLGGNYVRFAFIGTNEIWIEQISSIKDIAETIIHEIIETIEMTQNKLSYEQAHAKASQAERLLRNHYEKIDDIKTVCEKYINNYLSQVNDHESPGADFIPQSG